TSTGERTQPLSFTAGAAGRLTGLYAQYSRSLSVTLSPLWAKTGPDSDPGQGAPALTQRGRTAISLAGSLPLGGSWSPSGWLMAWSSRLASGLSSETAGPSSPPLSSPARLVRESLPRGFLSPWHLKQRAWRIGSTSLLKKASPSVGGVAVGLAAGGATERTA